ncbi:MAG: hypothetical protein K2P19_11845 [Kineothrix sp.]|nr:hypothetical protein [Kineothrix sp.]
MRKIGKILLVGLAATMFVACGKASGEEIARVQGMYADLVEQHNEVVEVYAGVEDDSLGKELEEMAKKIEDIGQQDIQDMDDAKLDDVVEQMNGYAKEYERMMAELEAVKEQEGEPEVYAVPVSLKNSTGVGMYEIYLYEASSTDKGKNLVEDMENLDGLGTLNILNIFVTKGEELWHLEALDDGGTVIESADIEFTEEHKNGVTINMEYSFDSMEGWIKIE